MPPRNQYQLPVRGTGVGSQYSMGDAMRGSAMSNSEGDGPIELPKNMADYEGGRMTLDTRGTESSWGGGADRMTSADRMTTASSFGGRGTTTRIGDRMTAMTDDEADMAPGLGLAVKRHGGETELGDDWEEQQRMWAGGRAPLATGPRHVEDFSEIEEANGGVQGDRYGYAGARSTAGATARRTEGGNFPQGPAPNDGSRDSRDSASSRLSTSGVQGGRRKPGQAPPNMPVGISDVMKYAPPEALHGSGEEQAASRNSVQGAMNDALSGKRFLNPAMRLQNIPEAQGVHAGAFPGDPRGSQNAGRGSSSSIGVSPQLQAPANRSGALGSDSGLGTDTVKIEWDKFPDLSSQWSEQYEALEHLLQRLDANPQAGLNQALLHKRKKAAGPNKVVVTSEGFKAFPQFKDIPADAIAMRDGRLKQILAQDLVPGDVVEIKAGQRVPADCRLLQASPDLRVEMGSIGYRTSDGYGPGHARDSLEVDETVGPWECKNLVFIGCMCERGTGVAVVIKTGGHTALGIVAREMGWAQPAESVPLHQTLGGFETAFEAHTERAARSLRLTNEEGRCICAVM